MTRTRILFGLGVLVVALCLPDAARAQMSERTLKLGLLAGIGGSVDASESGFGNASFELSFAARTERRLEVVGRVGILDLGERVGQLGRPDLTYVTAGGEYKYWEGYYEGGLFLGLGVYGLDGDDLVTGKGESETGVGLTAGTSGDFAINDRLSVLVEISGHYSTLSEASFFAMVHAGLGVKF